MLEQYLPDVVAFLSGCDETKAPTQEGVMRHSTGEPESKKHTQEPSHLSEAPIVLHRECREEKKTQDTDGRAIDGTRHNKGRVFGDDQSGVAKGEASGIASSIVAQTSSTCTGVLFHCVEGVSRSPSLLMAYLLQQEGLTLKQAFEIVKAARPCAQPRYQWFDQLMALERKYSKDGRNTATHEDNYVPIILGP